MYCLFYENSADAGNEIGIAQVDQAQGRKGTECQDVRMEMQP